MSAFELLHPSVQHHVVNSLGWTSLRPHQEEAIAPIISGAHVLVQAPTAGGKTEAALLPVLSRMLTGGWGAPGLLYLCPIKALLNDLEVRIGRLANLFGLRVALWHGDVGPSERRRITREPPDILLTTPESIEVMLVSRLVDHERFFASVRAVIVDEVHAFAGDDRGWHLLALLERVSQLAEAPVQRIALSATLANAGELLDWLVARPPEATRHAVERRVVAAPAPPRSEADVSVDYVGSAANAALVISRLHRGEKRLVFCDSRSQVEALAAELRAHGVDTYVSHSSLSLDERRRAEAAFAQGTDCVIVSTSTLELGLDVGDLDRVVQIDAPYTVASFLQRLGRSGRREGSRRSCLFLATTEDALVRAVGVVRLWEAGFVEPIRPPALPYHVLAQQVLALVLQQACTLPHLHRRLAHFREAAGISGAALDALVAHMEATRVLFSDGGVLGVGAGGEARYGRKNFLELFSVFLSPPLFSVFHGPAALGQVHEESFRERGDQPTLLSLGGRGWRVTHLDWNGRRAYVEPVELKGRSRWLGTGQPAHFALCRAVGETLSAEDVYPFLSRRAAAQLTNVRAEFAWLQPESTALVERGASAAWWTFAGDRYNAAAVAALAAGGVTATYDSFRVRFGAQAGGELASAVRAARVAVAARADLGVQPRLLDRIKFSDCLPSEQQEAMLRSRFSPGTVSEIVLQEPLRVVSA